MAELTMAHNSIHKVRLGHENGRADRKDLKREFQGPSSQNRNGSGRKKAEGKGKAQKRKWKGSTGGTAVGAKPGGMKGNKQKAE